MPGPVTFNYDAWSGRYPEFSASVTPSLAQQYFTEAGLYCDNTAASPVQDPAVLLMLLNMLTAHIAALNAPQNGQPSSPLVGRISNASEGSVSVQTELEGQLQGRAWYAQTKYGLAYWQATAQYRTAQYFPSCPRVMDPWNPGFGSGY